MVKVVKTSLWTWNPETQLLRAIVTAKGRPAWVEYTRRGKRIAWVSRVSEKALAETDAKVREVMKLIPRRKPARARQEPDLLDAVSEFLDVAEPVIRLLKLVA